MLLKTKKDKKALSIKGKKRADYPDKSKTKSKTKEKTDKEEIGDKQRTRQNIYKILIGSLAGLCNGLFGGGGGMIVVPMLTMLLKYPEKQAHATTILIILPLSITSGLLYSSFGFVNGEVLFPTMAGVIAGGVAGALLLKRINSAILGYVFSAVMIFAGLKMIFL